MVLPERRADGGSARLSDNKPFITPGISKPGPEALFVAVITHAAKHCQHKAVNGILDDEYRDGLWSGTIPPYKPRESALALGQLKVPLMPKQTSPHLRAFNT